MEQGFEAAHKLMPAASILRTGTNIMKNSSRVIAVAAVGLTIIDAATDPKGPSQWKYGVDAAMGTISVFFPVFGVIWFGANLVSMIAHDGEGVGERVQDNFE